MNFPLLDRGAWCTPALAWKFGTAARCLRAATYWPSRWAHRHVRAHAGELVEAEAVLFDIDPA